MNIKISNKEAVQVSKSALPKAIVSYKMIGCKEACALLNISPITLKSLRENGMMPFVKVGNKFCYWHLKATEINAVLTFKDKRRKRFDIPVLSMLKGLV